jgi:hypothetical protein
LKTSPLGLEGFLDWAQRRQQLNMVMPSEDKAKKYSTRQKIYTTQQAELE